MSSPISLSSLNPGIHAIHFRFKDDGDNWASATTNYFNYDNISIPVSQKNITQYEYWFNSNYADKHTVNISPTSNLYLTSNIIMDSVGPGCHSLHFRFKDDQDNWSAASSNDSICVLRLQLKAFIEGYYIGNGLMSAALYNSQVIAEQNLSDSISIELRSTNSPYNEICKSQAIISTDGYANFTLPSSVFTNSYYIVFKHRNSLETWSSQPILFNNSTVNYNFTSALTNAFGNNLVDLGDGNFAIYSGDVDNNGIINTIDFSSIQNNIRLFNTGYLNEDITGDGLIESTDNSLIENNIGRILMRP